MFGQFCSFLECKLIGWYGGGWKADARFLPTLYVACIYRWMACSLGFQAGVWKTKRFCIHYKNLEEKSNNASMKKHSSLGSINSIELNKRKTKLWQLLGFIQWENKRGIYNLLAEGQFQIYWNTQWK